MARPLLKERDGSRFGGSEPAPQTRPSVEQLKRGFVLVVDDERYITALVADVLRDRYFVFETESAEEAVEALRSSRFDLVISDINLKGMSGLELLNEIARVSPDTVSLLLSGASTLDNAVEALRRGAFDFISKPFDTNHLRAAVDRAFEFATLKAEKRRYEASLVEMVEERTRQLQHNAFHDELTGLPNRALLLDRARSLVERARRAGEQPLSAFLMVGLDRLKYVNTSLGHTTGDELLRVVASRLAAMVEPGNTVARVGGDRFAILLDSVESHSEGFLFAERLVHSMDTAVVLPGGRSLYTTASVGITFCSRNTEGADGLMREAEAALDRAKKLGGRRHESYDPRLQKRADEMLTVENGLRTALIEGQLVLHYQPIVSVPTGVPCGFEALVRWEHPEEGLIYPGRFIPIAEETGLILQLDRYVLARACETAGAWCRRLPESAPFFISVNLSARQFATLDLCEYVAGVLRASGLPAHRLKIEMTETAFMENEEVVSRTLEQLKAMGVKLATDDFGTGYCSLSYLHRYPVHTIKIDRSFIGDIDTDAGDYKIVSSIIAMAESLSIDVIAEGVETADHLAALRTLGCGYAQGYLFSRPVPEREAEGMLTDWPQSEDALRGAGPAPLPI